MRMVRKSQLDTFLEEDSVSQGESCYNFDYVVSCYNILIFQIQRDVVREAGGQNS